VEVNEESVEFSARTVEEAIAEGLAALGKNEDEVEIEILSRGSRGLLGLGAENARVRITPKAVGEVARAAATMEAEAPAVTAIAPEAGSVRDVSREILTEILRLMKVGGRVEVLPCPEDGSADEKGFVLNVQGTDAGLLIGRRGETLAALQYLLRQIVGHRTGNWVPIVVDVEGYKEHRRQSLQALALRMAERVTSTGQAVALEAMPPAERRIIHLALRNHPSVMTKSIGEGDSRKVMILPKE
jgi:spoIIIJ-associated protein